jgi:3' exoribonuclease, RNase T-like
MEPNMTHIMVDTEATHTDPEEGGILQLSAIKFDPVMMRVGETFDRCPALLPRRNWSDGTRKFWNGHRAVLDTIVARQEPAEQVFKDFIRFCSDKSYVFVAKPVKFDWPFVESHCTQLGLPFPFAHHCYLDLHSYISGLRGTPFRTDIENEVPFPAGGSIHNALHDCAYQIDLLFAAQRSHVHAEVIG